MIIVDVSYTLFSFFYSSKAFLMSVYDQTWTLFKPPHAKYFLTCCCLHMGIFAVSGGIALFMPDILNKLAIARNTLGYDNIYVCDVYDIPKEIFYSFNETALEGSVSILYILLYSDKKIIII